jgi:hypothetical protein
MVRPTLAILMVFLLGLAVGPDRTGRARAAATRSPIETSLRRCA